MNAPSPIRNLLLVLGDQLNENSALFDGFDPERDVVWMAENAGEATHVWCHKIRLVFFFSAMRHFRDGQQKRGRRVRYHALTADSEKDSGGDFGEILAADLKTLRPEALRVVKPGDLRVEHLLRDSAEAADLPLELLPDRHFYVTPEEFAGHAGKRKKPVMEYFYREQRRRFGILVDADGSPEGGSWNYDQDNRVAFDRNGPPDLPAPLPHPPDALTREVMELVRARFADHPGRLEGFDWPVTAEDARAALEDFIHRRLPLFGKYEDAMWLGESRLYHSRLSAMLNVKLLDPRDCVEAALRAYREKRVPLNSAEGFIRQILGWREFIRGVYNLKMPGYAKNNALGCADRNVPSFFWDGKTDMVCVADCMESVLNEAWSHHIPRLMVLGQYAMLLGVHPARFHEWHMAMYVDAVDWVSLPNTLGMSQFGDGGIVGTKPYCASGNYINRMSNYCGECRYRPKEATGEKACPFTTLYWDFLDRHRERFARHPRMKLQMRNLERKPEEQLREIRKRADALRAEAERNH